jgi:hypothetical protein
VSDVLRRIAALHRERYAKLETERVENAKILATKQAYFRDSGIPEMWEAVKDIYVANPAPHAVEGFTVPLSALVVDYDDRTRDGYGLMIHGPAKSQPEWYVDLDKLKDTPTYRYFSAHKNFSAKATDTDAKKKFCESFVRFLAKLITPQVLLGLDVDLSAPAPEKKITRKFLQVATDE